MKILLADDEKPLLHFLEKGLRAEGYECICVSELHEVVPSIRKHFPQVIILDRLFGGQDSLSLIESIKTVTSPPMILILTALDEVSERVKGLQQGADDYLCKPFDFDELLARVEALRRRFEKSSVDTSSFLTIGSLEILMEERVARLKGEEIALTKIEYELLLYLVQNVDRVLSRERILNRVWKTSSDPQTNIIDVYISKLRKKLEREPQINIKTLRGNGYRLSLVTNAV